MGEVAIIRDGCRIKQFHKVGKILLFTIMRGCRGEHECIGLLRKESRQIASLTGEICYCMAFINSNNIPVSLLQEMPEFPIVFQCINRNNDFIIVVERVLVDRDI